MIGDFDMQVSALEILFSCNFMLCKYLPFNGVCIDILDLNYDHKYVTLCKESKFIFLFRQGDINKIIFRLS